MVILEYEWYYRVNNSSTSKDQLNLIISVDWEYLFREKETIHFAFQDDYCVNQQYNQETKEVQTR